ncbi:DUF262 domain-containing protein [Burkholderia seminalis]|uniref:DUF262 domain-containing protein n=1 Tax=Burkholderia seminalis TaxID=488731 RepID=UPI0019046148|nr:DUF262 domain-containing protein [Burkholderia seminalis]MBJ9594773.1 DUF262 domain-containing protein [Burkholderia seminalis]
MPIEPHNVADDIDEDEEFVDETVLEESSDSVIDEQVGSQPFRVVYQTNNFFLPQIRDLITDGEDFNLRPEYQRRLRWSNQQKSLLIESLLLNVPIPPVFLYENDLARYEVMDGQQRLNAIKEFLSNDFALRGLQIIPSLNGKTYNKLPPKVKRSLDRASISAIVLLQESQGKIRKAGASRFYELRRFVFERLNTGGKRLSAQEIRNAIYGGEFNELIVRLSRDDVFTRIWGIPSYTNADPNEYYEDEVRQKNALYKTMGDCQLVLRFFALQDDAHIQGAMKSMLDKCMQRNIDCTAEEAKRLEDRFLSRLRFSDELFDQHPFSLTVALRGAAYRPVAGIYDGVMVALDEIWESRERLMRNKKRVQDDYFALIDRHGEGTLTGSANTAADIKNRINIFRQFFGEYL